MDKISETRAWLLARKGHWSQIAERTRLSTKTIHRFVHDSDWNFTFSTYMRLREEMERHEQAAAA